MVRQTENVSSPVQRFSPTSNLVLGRPSDPLPGFRFRVSIQDSNNVNVNRNLGFMRISGLGQLTKEFKYREGINGATIHKLPDTTEFKDVTLEKGKMVGDTILLDWINKMQADSPISKIYVPLPEYLKDIFIFVSGYRTNTITRMFSLTKCWPKDYSITPLDATQSTYIVDKLVLAVNGYNELPFHSQSRFARQE